MSLFLSAPSGIRSPALVVGLYLPHKIGFSDGLFGAAPRWTPR
jgi:hypothetical protein